MKTLYIADAAKHENGAPVDIFLAVCSKQMRSKKDGAQFLSLRLADMTGQCEAVMWENFDECLREFECGDVVKIRGRISRFSGKLQLSIELIRRAFDGEYDIGDFAPHTQYDVDELWAKLTGFVVSLTDLHLRALMEVFFADEEIAAALRTAPAAKTMHHAWIGGLLEHVVSLLGLCDLAAGHYPHIHRDLLLAGAMLHDIGKLHELRWGTTFDYTTEGQLLGHITIGIGMIEKKSALVPGFPAQLRLLLEHIVLSHHGRYEYGSPKLPMVPEAILLHYLDDLDAKMHTMQSEFAKNEANGRAAGEMTEWVRSLERPLLDTHAFLGETEE